MGPVTHVSYLLYPIQHGKPISVVLGVFYVQSCLGTYDATPGITRAF